MKKSQGRKIGLNVYLVINKNMARNNPDELNKDQEVEETPDQKATSEQLRQMAKNLEEQEHGHDEHDYAQKAEEDKVANEIMARAENASPEVRKRAETFIETAKNEGIMGVEGSRNYIEEAIDNFGGEITDRYYPGWKKKDIEELYQVLYGERYEEESPEERRQRGEELAKDIIARKMPEGALPDNSSRTQETENEAKRRRLGEIVAEAARKKKEEELIKQQQEEEKLAKIRREQEEKQKAEDDDNKRWFGLKGVAKRFFK